MMVLCDKRKLWTLRMTTTTVYSERKRVNVLALYSLATIGRRYNHSEEGKKVNLAKSSFPQSLCEWKYTANYIDISTIAL